MSYYWMVVGVAARRSRATNRPWIGNPDIRVSDPAERAGTRVGLRKAKSLSLVSVDRREQEKETELASQRGLFVARERYLSHRIGFNG